MNVDYTLFVILAPIATVVSLGTTGFVWRHKNMRTPGASTLVWLSLAISGWLVANTLELILSTEVGTLFWAEVVYIFVTLAPVGWWAFALQHTRRHQWLSFPRLAPFFLIPITTIILVWTNPYHQLIWQDYRFVFINDLLAMVVTEYGSWFWVHILHAYSLIFLGALVIGRDYFESFSVYRRQSAWMLLGAISPLIINLVYILRIFPDFKKDYSAIGFAFSGLAFTIAISRYRLFDLRPVARDLLIDSMDDGMFVLDEKDQIVDVNPTGERILGRSGDEIVGQSALEIFSPWPELRKHVQEAMELRTDVSLEREGELWYYNLRISPLNERHEHFVGRLIHLHDVTERKRIAEALWQSEQQFRGVVEQSYDGIVLVDEQGKIVEWNRGQVAITGRREKEVLGLPIWEVQFESVPRERRSPELYENIRASILRFLERGQVTSAPMEEEIERPDGQRRVIQSVIFPIETDNGFMLGAITRDVTESREAAARLRQYAKDLEARNADLDAFAHTVAHDLKNPLSSLIGYADLLTRNFERLSPADLRVAVQSIEQLGFKMNSIVEGLMILSGLRATRIELHPLNMGDIVQEACDRLSEMIDRHGVEVILPESWPEAWGYPSWVEEIWVNYISNAIKYGGSPPRVELGATVEEDGWVRFWVRDNGAGISPAARDRLFIPFERLGQTHVEGHGLGLSIVRRIVEKLGGEVSLESDPDTCQGSTFGFTLPAV